MAGGFAADVSLWTGGVPRPAGHFARTPIYLRFVVKGENWKTLDALDQLGDTPGKGERVIAAKRGRYSTGIVCTRGHGRRGGSCCRPVRFVNYLLVDPQPPAEVLHDTARWQEWVVEQLKQSQTSEG